MFFLGLSHFTTQNTTKEKSTYISSKVARTNEKVLIINYNLVKEVGFSTVLQQIVCRPHLRFPCLTHTTTSNNFTLR